MAYWTVRNTLTYRFMRKNSDIVYNNYFDHSDRLRRRLDNIKFDSCFRRNMDEITVLQKEMERKMNIATEILKKISYEQVLFSFETMDSFYTDEDRAKMNWKLDI